MAPDILDRFSPATRAWFTTAFAAPTPVQEDAWEAISSGEHALVVSPTGSGKTLAAFLWALDRLATEPAAADPRRRCRIVYVSPLKALAVDIERNLRTPLAGIRQAAAGMGLPVPTIDVDVRSGDTPAGARRTFLRHPGDVLITTPESLFLLLTSQARGSLRGVHTVIVDEVHAVVATKRGAHLALSLERLCHLVGHPVQRIGLSATVRPTEEVATFLGGDRPVRVVAPPTTTRVDLSVVVPVTDMAAPGSAPSIWPAVEETVTDLVLAHRSTIVFANSRRVAERLTARLNDLAAARGHPQPIARAHHGSVSAAQRSLIEEDLKAGRLPAVVATSSLELGIDMGAVDLVVQIEAPPSVASGLQRVGRAGHHVGVTSRGVVLPKYRADLLAAAVVAERMRDGLIEASRYPRNPLDVLAQQVVAMVAMDDWSVDELARLVRRAAPYAALPDSALEAVLDMLAGRYPAEEFASLRPRLVWDRITGVLSARPGAARLAVTSGGTIPDRGLFGVFLAGQVGAPGARVGELDEEMVYESRVGDVFTLGASSWRIEAITHDRVLVSPAPGRPGKVPFWHGDALGRPAELGRALGAFVRELGRLDDAAAVARARAAGLDERAAQSLVGYLREQQAATGQLPDDRTIVVERFRDELGDWRVVVHSPFGAPVHAPWALLATARARDRFGVAVAAMHADDGLVLRWPETDGEDTGVGSRPPDVRELLFGAPEEVQRTVTAEVGGSALFAARFRECAARALLLPRRYPGRRAPLWQQRQRASQLLGVASRYPAFPIVVETVREVLADVYDTAALVELLRDVEARRVRVVEVDTPVASPFARALLFGYVAAFMYEGDAPLAERRAAALALDTGLLTELLGRVDLRELFDADVLAQVASEVGWLTPTHAARDAEGVADMLRVLGPLTVDEVASRCAHEAGDPLAVANRWLADLQGARRALQVRVGGIEQWTAIEDAGRLRDGLGVALPAGVPVALLDPVADSVADLVTRHARTHGPFTAADVASRFGLGVAVVTAALERLAAGNRVVAGEFRPGEHGDEWCDVDVAARIRRRSLAALRRDVEAVPAQTLGVFLPAWQGVQQVTSRVTGDAEQQLARTVGQLAGAPVPASALELLVLGARVPGYSGVLLDAMTASGEVVWAGHGVLPAGDGWVALYPAELAPLLLPDPDPAGVRSRVHDTVLEILAGGGAYFFRTLADQVAARLGVTEETATDAAVIDAIWDLVWSGHLTNDTLAPLRTRLGGTRAGRSLQPRQMSRPRGRRFGATGRAPGWPQPGGRMLAGRPSMPTRNGPPTVAGRWSLLGPREADPTRRAHAIAETLLDRHGVVTRGAVAAEGVPGGFAGVYRVLSAFEEAGRIRRGYVLAGLGAAQFATTGAIDRLRALAADQPTGPDSDRDPGLVLAAADPANPYGAALPWPAPPTGGHRPARKAGALVVLVGGRLIWYVERGGHSLISWSQEDDEVAGAASALAHLGAGAAARRMTIQRVGGQPVAGTAAGEALLAAGFVPTPQGLRLRR